MVCTAIQPEPGSQSAFSCHCPQRDSVHCYRLSSWQHTRATAERGAPERTPSPALRRAAARLVWLSTFTGCTAAPQGHTTRSHRPWSAPGKLWSHTALGLFTGVTVGNLLVARVFLYIACKQLRCRKHCLQLLILQPYTYLCVYNVNKLQNTFDTYVSTGVCVRERERLCLLFGCKRGERKRYQTVSHLQVVLWHRFKGRDNGWVSNIVGQRIPELRSIIIITTTTTTEFALEAV